MTRMTKPHLTQSFPILSLKAFLYKTWALHLILKLPAKSISSSGTIIPTKRTELSSFSSTEKPEEDRSSAFKVIILPEKGCLKIMLGDGDIFCLMVRYSLGMNLCP